MIILIAALAIAAITGTIVLVRKDGYHRTPTDPSRVPDRSTESLLASRLR